MTDERLRELLHEHVEDLAPTDLGAAAWTAARRTRQRRMAGGAAAAVASLALVAGVVATTRNGDPVDPVTTPQVIRPSAMVEPGADYRGAKTWWAPSNAEEKNLPLLAGTPLPDLIDLAAGAPAHRPGVRAVAVFEIAGESVAPGRVVIVGTDGASYSLDVGRLDRVTDEQGNALSPLTQESLAPDGRHMFFIQDSSLEVYDLTTGDWTTYETVPWLAETAKWISDVEVWAPGELGAPDGTGTSYDVTGSGADTTLPDVPRVWDTADEPWGPVRVSAGDGVAQGLFLADEATDPDGRVLGGLDALAARVGPGEGKDVHLLVAPGLDDGRWKGCCPVVGWLDDRTVLLQSRSGDFRILAWRVGTTDLQRVSRLTGWTPGEESPIGSFADLR